MRKTTKAEATESALNLTNFLSANITNKDSHFTVSFGYYNITVTAFHDLARMLMVKAIQTPYTVLALKETTCNGEPYEVATVQFAISYID